MCDKWSKSTIVSAVHLPYRSTTKCAYLAFATFAHTQDRHNTDRGGATRGAHTHARTHSRTHPSAHIICNNARTNLRIHARKQRYTRTHTNARTHLRTCAGTNTNRMTTHTYVLAHGRTYSHTHDHTQHTIIRMIFTLRVEIYINNEQFLNNGVSFPVWIRQVLWSMMDGDKHILFTHRHTRKHRHTHTYAQLLTYTHTHTHTNTHANANVRQRLKDRVWYTFWIWQVEVRCPIRHTLTCINALTPPLAPGVDL